MPGDSLIADAARIVTHGITIGATPEDVWPWLAQMGSGRAGWYSYDFVDNDGHPSAAFLDPALQHVAPGDILPSLPGERTSFIVHSAERARDLVLVVPAADGRGLIVTWEFALEAADAGTTRLVVRGRIGEGWPGGVPRRTAEGPPRPIERVYALLAMVPGWLMIPIALAGHHLMQARQLRGIQRRAEGRAVRLGSSRGARIAA